ncbi:Uncharacterized protein dnl_13240 [Desulfonema limicola]|uniref:Uncharacterized protein n=1 Tax=Desulfonema limicola TaxID=45656 RepID=A0A975B5B8_9BACT|nr:Uncharacterized protein dnl_13240 [Desulfonema limicola]
MQGQAARAEKEIYNLIYLADNKNLHYKKNELTLRFIMQ